MNENRLTFGPVPSRRLGQSLGINNVPPKTCTYSCIYCQVGHAKTVSGRPRELYKPDTIIDDVRGQLKHLRTSGAEPDVLTFVPDGEPTLDRYLGRDIQALLSEDIKIAVITNSSLLTQPAVRDALLAAHWVSVKIDAVSKRTWQRINRPHPSLNLDPILQSILDFSHDFSGTLVTETMLVRGINDEPEEIRATAECINKINPDTAYLSIPTRPPAESRVRAPQEHQLISAFNIFSDSINHVEYLIGYEGNAFASTGDVKQDIARITAVHPMRQDAVQQVLHDRGADWSVIDQMLDQHVLAAREYRGEIFYTRVLNPVNKKP